jgi:hypothetical protein
MIRICLCGDRNSSQFERGAPRIAWVSRDSGLETEQGAML